MQKKVFAIMTVAMVLAFITTLALVGCGQEDTDPTSITITISGTAKVGETLTATSNSSKNLAESVWWSSYYDASTSYTHKNSNHDNFYSDTLVLTEDLVGKWIQASIGEGPSTFISNILGPVGGGGPSESVTISPTTAIVAKNGTQSFTVTINEPVTVSTDVGWTVTPDTDGSTITGGGQSIIGSTTTQTRTLNVASGETASILTVTVTYNGKSAMATVAVTD